MKYKFQFLFFFILLLGNNLAFSQNEKKVTVFDDIYKKIKLLSKAKKNQEALLYSKKLLQKSLESKNITQQAKAYYKLAEFYNKLNIRDSAFYFHNKSKEFYLHRNDSIQIGRNLLNIAIIESDFGSYSLSDSTAVESIKYINEKRPRTIASAYNCLAINSKRRFLNKDAITYYNKALNITDNKSSRIRYKNNIAILYKDLKNYPKAIFIFQELLKDTIINQKTKARVIDNLAYTKWLQDSKVNVLQDLLLANSLKQKNKDIYGLIASNSHLSDYYRDSNQKKSLFYAKKAYQISKSKKSVTGQLETIDKIVNLETPKKSIKYFKESIRLRDSLQEANTKRQYKFAKIKYDYEEEEKQKLKFKALATENELIAEQENNQKNNIFIITLLTISSLVFLLYRRKLQNRKRVLQETYNTETRIAKKLHDELGNDVFNVMTKVQNSKFESAEIVNDLDKIYLQTRTISHENDIIKTGDKFEEFFRSLVTNYNSAECKIILKDLNQIQLNSISDEKQIIIYRVFNELFVNMKKHSKASLVLVSCEKVNNLIKMVYTDNGVGFKENNIVFKNGLKNMETRIKTIKGTLKFENKPEKGLKVIFQFKK